MTDPEAHSPIVARQFMPNRMGRMYLLSYEDILGHNALHALLKMAGHEPYAHLFPPNNSDRQFEYTVVSGLTNWMLQMYGPRGGRSAGLRIGHSVFNYALRDYGPMMGVTDLAFQLLPSSIKLEKGIEGMYQLLNTQGGQQIRLQETPDKYYWHDACNPVCWDIVRPRPSCFITVGILQEAMFWLSGGKIFQIEETACCANGADECIFTIDRQPLE